MSHEETAAALEGYPGWQQFACSKYAGIGLVALSQFTIIFKKQLEEMKLLSYFFMFIIVIFVALLFSELMTDSIDV